MLTHWIEKRAPAPVYAVAASAYWVLHPRKEKRLIYPSRGCWRARTKEGGYYTIRDNPARGSPTYQEQKFERYTREGFCTIGAKDTVVDVGAFIGEFTVPAARTGAEVLAIEPDETAYRCLQAQTAGYERVTTSNALVADRQMETTFNTSPDPTENSLLTPDNDSYRETTREALPLDQVLADYGINTEIYLKLDAEGAEPEVLQGITTTPVENFAIDTGPERDGETTTSQVVEILERRGYETLVETSGKGVVTFGRKPAQ